MVGELVFMGLGPFDTSIVEDGSGVKTVWGNLMFHCVWERSVVVGNGGLICYGLR